MAQRYEAGKEFKELLIGNYDLYEREKAKPQQLTLFEVYGIGEGCDYEKTLKECIISCRIKDEKMYIYIQKESEKGDVKYILSKQRLYLS